MKFNEMANRVLFPAQYATKTKQLLASRTVLWGLTIALTNAQPAIEACIVRTCDPQKIYQIGQAALLAIGTALWRYSEDDTLHTPPWLPGRNKQ